MSRDACIVFCSVALRLWHIWIEGCHTRGSQITVVIPLLRGGSPPPAPLVASGVGRTCEDCFKSVIAQFITYYLCAQICFSSLFLYFVFCVRHRGLSVWRILCKLCYFRLSLSREISDSVGRKKGDILSALQTFKDSCHIFSLKFTDKKNPINSKTP